MQTVDKAMKLLSFFTATAPEIGLSELARLANYDKAATRRFLVALSKHGLIEQNPADRRYRLGPAFLRFARVRELNVPLTSIVQPVINRIAEETGETAHASLFSGSYMSTIAIAEPQRATRVFVDPAQPLALHATASGQCCLAFMEEKAAKDTVAKIPLEKLTIKTVVSKKELLATFDRIRRRGFGRAEQSFEDDTTGTAVPIFDGTGKPIGAVAVASVASRFTKELDALVVRKLLQASIEITTALGGQPHESVTTALKSRLQP